MFVKFRVASRPQAEIDNRGEIRERQRRVPLRRGCASPKAYLQGQKYQLA
jgi:hypothetical protein